MSRVKSICGVVLTALAAAGCIAEQQSPMAQEADFAEACSMDVAAAANDAPVRMKSMATDAAADNFAVPEGRKMIFSADYRLTVPDVRTAQNSAKAAAEKLGGYMQHVNDYSITLRIPMARASEALAMVSGLGKVDGREINGQDVTDQFFDAETRLSNLEIMQKRLQKLAEQSGKVDDLLKVERELARVTTEIEQLKGRLKLLGNRVDYLTLTLSFNAEVQPLAVQNPIPVSWVTSIGSEVMQMIPENERTSYAFDVELPENFAVIYGGRRETYAAAANGAVIKLSRRSDLKNAGDDFWRDLLTRALKERGFTELTAKNIVTPEGMSGFEIGGRKAFLGDVVYLYRMLVVRFDHELYLYESWYPVGDDAMTERLDASYKTLNLSIWR
ncbi:MAG: DUF4349 domain-containing protein [Victivallaceae bacterium]|nr:DUF4349 domain-containing protein [Victivallaceae bacterium]